VSDNPIATMLKVIVCRLEAERLEESAKLAFYEGAMRHDPTLTGAACDNAWAALTEKAKKMHAEEREQATKGPK
jgi:hypothetical protein